MSDLRTAAQKLDDFLSQFDGEEQERILRYALDHVVPRMKRAALAAEPQPVATLHDDGSFTWKRDEFRLKYDRQRAGWRMDVYAAAPTAHPLTDEQIGKEFNRRISDAEDDVAFDLVDFKAGVRFAEKHYGIGGSHG